MVIPPRQYHYPQNRAQTHDKFKTYMLRFMTKMFHCQMYADKTAAQRQQKQTFSGMRPYCFIAFSLSRYIKK